MEQISSPYRIGAHRGLILGVALSVMFFASVYSEAIPLLGLVAVAIFFGVPFWLYHQLRKTYVADGGETPVSALCMQGIVIFGGGSSVLALASTIYMKWINPGFVMSMVDRAIEVYSSIDDPAAAQFADLLEQMVSAHAVPTATSIALEVVWLSIVSGALLSLLMAILARSRDIPIQREDGQQNFQSKDF